MKTGRRFVSYIILFAFWGLILFAAVKAAVTDRQTVNWQLFKKLISDRDHPHRPFGYHYVRYRRYLPEKGAITYIYDDLYDRFKSSVGKHYTAQAGLTPLVLNPEPVEQFAFVDCSRKSIAEKRLKEAGYRWLETLDGKKGVAVKRE